MDCSPPGASVTGILQARILEWVAISSSRGSSWPRDQICVFYISCIGRWILYHCNTRIVDLVHLWPGSRVFFKMTLEHPLDCREIQPVHPKEDQSWVFIGRTDVEAETPTLWPPDTKSWERDNRGWDGWMASPTRWTWVWVDSRSWWLTRRPDMLQFMGSQRVEHNLVTELNWNIDKQNNHRN